jgi:hypothetical protein
LAFTRITFDAAVFFPQHKIFFILNLSSSISLQYTPTPIRFTASPAVGLLHFSVNVDRFPVFPAIPTVCGLIGAYRGDCSRMTVVRIAPGGSGA